MKFVFALAGLAGLAFITGCSSTKQASTEYPSQGAAASEHVYYTGPARGATGAATTTSEGGVYHPMPVYTAVPIYTERVRPEYAWPDYRLNSAYRGYENHSDDWRYKYMAP
jgi:hypothetical protein